MPFSRQIRSKSTSTGGRWNRPVNTFPLSVRICWGTPWARIANASPSQTGWVRSRGISRADTQNREWSSIPVSAFAVVPSAIGTRPPRPSATARWAPTLPAIPCLVPPSPDSRVDHPEPDQTAVDRRLRGRRVGPQPQQLEPDPPRPPVRAGPAQLEHPSLQLRGQLVGARGRPVRPVRQTRQPFSLITGQPRVQRLPTYAPLTSDLTDRPAISDHRENRLIPLLCHAQLPHIEGVSRISRRSRQPSAEDV